MTANALKGDREMRLDAGMDGHINKPVKKEFVFRRSGECSAMAMMGGDRGAACLMRRELLEHVDNDTAFLADTVQMLETDGRAMMVELKTAVAAGDAPAVGRTAHTLKGMISNFCAPAVQTLAQEG